MLGNFSCFLLTFFKKKNISGTLSKCQTAHVWIQIRSDIQRFVGPDLGPNVLHRLSADGKLESPLAKKELNIFRIQDKVRYR